MGKKRKIFIFSALAAGLAIFFGRKRRMKAKSEEAEGEWTPDEDATSDADGSSDGSSDSSSDSNSDSSATEGDTADDADSDASGDTVAADEEEAEKTD